MTRNRPGDGPLYTFRGPDAAERRARLLRDLADRRRELEAEKAKRDRWWRRYLSV